MCYTLVRFWDQQQQWSCNLLGIEVLTKESVEPGLSTAL